MTLQKLSEYGKGFQIKVIGALLTERKFLLDVRDVLQVNYFDAEAHKWIVKEVVNYFDKYNTTITMEVLKVELQKLDNDILKTAAREELRHSYQATKEDLEYVQEEFTTFCKNQELKAALLESADLLDAGNYDAIRSRVDAAMKAGMSKDIGHNYNKDIEVRYREDYRPTIPTPWPMFNKNFQGGFGPGDLAIVFGNPGGGKSWTCVAMAAHAVKMGYNVNYYTLELGEDYVGKRFDCYFTGYSIDRHGNIRIPYLGELNVLGYTEKEVREKIETELGKFFKNPELVFITVKLGGISFIVTGEVGSPGTINLSQNQVSIIDAISNAGEINDVGNRSEVTIIRKTLDGVKKYKLDYTKIEVFESDNFYIQPNDIIYVPPLKQKAWGVGTTGMQAFSTAVTVLSFIASTVLLVKNL